MRSTPRMALMEAAAGSPVRDTESAASSARKTGGAASLFSPESAARPAAPGLLPGPGPPGPQAAGLRLAELPLHWPARHWQAVCRRAGRAGRAGQAQQVPDSDDWAAREWPDRKKNFFSH
jgi:hypothetical protein